jgi:uncharacterized protein with PQ loop repeat
MELLASHATAVVGWSLAIASTVTAWPQAVKLARTRNTNGISVRSVALATLTMVAWSAYTIRIGDVPAAASSVGPLSAWGTTLLLLIACKVPGAGRFALVTIAVSLIVIAVVFTPYWWIIGGAAAAGSAGWALPQLRTAFTTENLEGVSVTAFAAMAVENIGWIVYAVLTSTPAYAVGSSIQAPATAIIALKAARSYPSGGPTPAPDLRQQHCSMAR